MFSLKRLGIGVGAIVISLATTAFADLTGVFLAGIAAVVGLFIIPVKKRSVKGTFTKEVGQVRDQLSAILTGEFEKQMNRIVNHVEETIAPYNRFIRAEVIKLDHARENTEQIAKEIYTAREEIKTLYAK